MDATRQDVGIGPPSLSNKRARSVAMVSVLFQFGYFRVGQLMTLPRLRAIFKSDVFSGLFPYPFIQVFVEHLLRIQF